MTSPRQAGVARAYGALRNVLYVLGSIVLFWAVVLAVVWMFTGSGDTEQPGVFSNTTTPQQPGIFANTTSPQQPGAFANTTSSEPSGTSNAAYPPSQPGSTAPTYTIPAQK